MSDAPSDPRRRMAISAAGGLAVGAVAGLAGGAALASSATPAPPTIVQGHRARQNVHGMQRAAEPHEIAAAILNLASPDMTYLNGALVFVDGGMTAAL